MRTTKGARLLKEWMEQRGLSADRLGELVGVDGVSVANWTQRGKVPKLASAIQLETHCGIPCESWLET